MFLLLILCLGLAFRLQKIVYGRYWSRGLLVTADFMDTYVYEGDTSWLKEEISNNKMLPLPAVEVRLSMNRNLEFSGEARENSNITDQSYKRDVFSLLFHQKIIHRLPFVCTRRGFYEIPKMEIVGYDLFFKAGHYMEISQHTQLYVYPSQVDARRIRLVCQAISGMILVQNRLYPDPFEFSGIRDYLPTDPMNHINWKASARSDSLMVNQFDSTTSIHVTVVLDVEDSNILRYESLTEESIRIASSLAARMVREKMELKLISNGVYKNPDSGFREEELSWYLKAGAGKVQELNRKLACIDTEREISPVPELLAREAARKPNGCIYVLISKNQDKDVMEKLRLLAGEGNEILWVVPVKPVMDLAFRDGPGIRLMRWEVEHE